MPDLYAVIGYPVGHSKSPVIHAAFSRQTGQALQYEAILSQPDAFEDDVAAFRAAGGRGLNVTVPFKQRAYGLAPNRTARAEQALAINTLVFDAESTVGDNTDGVGLVRDLTINQSCEVRGRRILLLGAGGASYGVCGPMLDQQPSALVVANRTVEKAQALCRHFRTCHAQAQVLTATSYAELACERFDVVINATSAGLSGEKPDVPAAVLGAGSLAYEMVYGRTTPFMEFAASAGSRVADGLGMLVEQAAESFYLWRGVRPETAPVIALLRS